MRFLFSFLLLLAVSAPLAADLQARRDLLDRSLLRLTIHHQAPLHYYPWKWSSPGMRSGQGIVVGDGLVLTLASMVKGSTLIEARRKAEPTPAQLSVLHVDLDRGLALLQGTLPEGCEPLTLPPTSTFRSGERVHTYWKTDEGRFMEGQAILDRVDSLSAPSSFQVLTWYEASNATVKGGFGEPVFLGDQLIGLGSSNGTGAELSILPVESIHLRYDLPSGQLKPASGMPGFATAPCQQPFLREHRGLSDEDGGCIVSFVMEQGTGSQDLKVGDIILEFEGKPLDAWGRYEHPEFGDLPFEGLISQKSLGEKVRFLLVRDQERISIEVPVEKIDPDRWVVPVLRFNQPSRYLIRGGFVFQNLSLSYVRAWGRDWRKKAPDNIQMTIKELRGVVATEDRREIVLLSQVLAHPVNQGLKHIGREVIQSVNGEALRDLEHLKTLMEGDEVVRLGLFPHDQPVLLDPKELRGADGAIEQLYSIPESERL